MFAAAAAQASHPAVAALLGIGAAGLASAVVAMAWNVHVRQIRLAELLARRQFIVAGGTGAAEQGSGSRAQGETAEHVNGSGSGAPVVIEGPDSVIAGEQVRYRVRSGGSRTVTSWAVGGGSVSQSPDPAHPDELLLIADRPGNLTIMVRVREGMTERRGTKPITAVAEVPVAPPFTLRLFLHGWGLVAVAVLVAGLAAALDALGNLSSADFIALVAPLTALLSVVAVARAMGDPPSSQRGTTTAPKLAEPAVRFTDPPVPVRAYPADRAQPGDRAHPGDRGHPADRTRTGDAPVRNSPAA